MMFDRMHVHTAKTDCFNRKRLGTTSMDIVSRPKVEELPGILGNFGQNELSNRLIATELI